MGLTIGIWFIAFIGIALLFWINGLLKEQDERIKYKQMKK